MRTANVSLSEDLSKRLQRAVPAVYLSESLREAAKRYVYLMESADLDNLSEIAGVLKLWRSQSELNDK